MLTLCKRKRIKMCGGMIEDPCIPPTNNTKILNSMQTKLTHTLADMKEITVIRLQPFKITPSTHTEKYVERSGKIW